MLGIIIENIPVRCEPRVLSLSVGSAPRGMRFWALLLSFVLIGLTPCLGRATTNERNAPAKTSPARKDISKGRMNLSKASPSTSAEAPAGEARGKASSQKTHQSRGASPTRTSAGPAPADVGVLALPLRSTKAASRAFSAGETATSVAAPPSSSPAAQASAPEKEPPPAAASSSKIIPTFYGDFAPARSSGSSQAQAPQVDDLEKTDSPEPVALQERRNDSPLAHQGPPSERVAVARIHPRQSAVSAPSVTLLSYDRTREVFQRLVPSAARFNTDYRTRPASCEIPLTLCGRGLQGRNLPIGHEDAWRDRLPPDYMPTDLVLIPVEWCYANQPIYLRREAAESLVRMLSDAQRQGLRIQVVSGYRDYSHQQRLYKQNGGRRGSRTVGRPGKSEHMLGTTVDVTSTEKYLLKPAFATTPEGKWLARNAHRYGWKLTVISGSRVIEPWHFRYFGRALGQQPASASSVAQGAPKSREALEAATKPLRATGKLLGRIVGK